MYVDAGPITYQLQVSRQLNQYAVEDRQYLAGLPEGLGTLTPSEFWYGVFLWAKNQTNEFHTTSDTFTITDTNGNTYHPTKLNAELNGYAWTSQVLAPHGDRARAEHDRELRPDAGRPGPVQAADVRVLEPPADAHDLPAERQAGADLARPLSQWPCRPATRTWRTAGAAVAPPAPWFGNSAPTTISRMAHRRVADEPRVGQRVGVGDASSAGGGGVGELGGPRLARHGHAGYRGSGAGPVVDHGHHHLLDLAGDVAARDADEPGSLVGLERRQRPAAPHRERRADVGHLERGGQDLALADCGGSDFEIAVQARRRDRALDRAGDRRGLVEAEFLGHREQPLRRRLVPRVARTPSCTTPRTSSGACRRSLPRRRCGACSRRGSPACCTGTRCSASRSRPRARPST